MGLKKGRLFVCWLHSRRTVILYTASVYAIFFIVYGVYGYGWGVAGYAALISLALGAVFALRDFAGFAARHTALDMAAGKFPQSELPKSQTLIEEDYTKIINLLEDERTRLENESEALRRDSEEYYTLWAHQIKTPIAAMRLVLQSGEGGLNKKEKSQVEQELFRIGQYVDMVLQYQRLSSLQSDLMLEAHSIEKLVKKAAKACAPLFIYKNLPLKTGEIAGSVITDEKWFCFVLEQIYTNAVKYTKSGAVKVYSEGENTLVVEDTGIGISPEDLPMVFQRGFTGAAGRTERSSTGIGLYLCKQVLAKLGFGIRVESALGRGTRVVLELGQQVLEQD